MAKKYLVFALSALAACQSSPSHPDAATQTPTGAAPLYHEPHRPQFHFSPKENWMNDPNGLVYKNGTYPLFFQQNPTAPVAGDIH